MRKTETKTKIKNNQKGITLIALVITIIVLLILAGVAISMLSGENGILSQAAKAKIQYEVAGLKEEVTIKIAEKQLDESLNKEKEIEEYLNEIDIAGKNKIRKITYKNSWKHNRCII